MLLRVERVSAPNVEDIADMFMIEDQILISHRNSRSMYAIDPINSCTNEVPVVYHDIFRSLTRARSAIAIDNGTAFKWTQEGMCRGAFEADSFHWRHTPTTGPEPRFSKKFLSAGVVDGDGATYLVLSHDSLVGRTQEPVEYAFYLYELNLRTMQWTRAAVVGSDCLKSYGWRMFASTMRLVATSSKLHIFSKDGDSEHMTIDRATKRWELTDVDPIYGNLPISAAFVVQDKLHSIAHDRARKMLTVYRYDNATKSCAKVCERPNQSNLNLDLLDMSCSEALVSGSLVYIVGNTSPIEHETKLECLLVLHLYPSLFDIALSAITRDESIKLYSTLLLPPRLVASVGSGVPRCPLGQCSLRACNGQFLRARRPTILQRFKVDLTPTREHWLIDRDADGKISLRIHGVYLRAKRSGGVSMVQPREETEKWRLTRNRDDSWSLRSAYGTWLSAHQANGLISTAPENKRAAHFWIES